MLNSLPHHRRSRECVGSSTVLPFIPVKCLRWWRTDCIHMLMCWVIYYSSFYTSLMSEMVENRLYTYADDSTLLAVVLKPTDRPAVADSL